jgi:stathmin
MAEEGDLAKGKNKSGVAFDVIIKPASTDNPPPLLHGSPTKEHPPLSLEDIDRKLKEAEERRLSVEASKLQAVNKDKEKLIEANQKVQEMEEQFEKETEKKLAEKMEASEEKKKALEQARQERLKEHDRHAEEVRKKKLSMSEDGVAQTS